MSKSERIRIHKSGFHKELYLNRKGEWGPWKHAAVFKTQTAADEFAAEYGVTNYGLF